MKTTRNTLELLIEKYPNKPWSWYWISTNSNITMEIIDKNIDKINFKSLSCNKFILQNKLLNDKDDLDILVEKVSKIV